MYKSKTISKEQVKLVNKEDIMKKGCLCVLTFTLFLMFTGKVEASSCSVSASSRNVTVGENVTIYVKASDLTANISSINASKGSITGLTDTWLENNTVSATLRATEVGTTVVSVALSPGASNGNGEIVNVGCNSVTITVNQKQTNTQKPSTNNTNTPKKSGDNDLSSLSIEGYEISFDKSKTNYSMTVPYGTEKIKINATKSHDKAVMSGDGEKEIKEGENKFDIVVTAENGEKKTYSITILVDSKPIQVKLENSEYTMVKKAEDLPEISLEHETIKLNIEDQEVEAYRIDKIDYVLVGLRNKEGNVNLYKFDSYKDETKVDYTPYHEMESGIVHLVYMVSEEIPNGYEKEEIEIGSQKVEAYKRPNSEFYLVYGLNIETDEKGWYSYDTKEKTLQRFMKAEKESTFFLDGNSKYIYIGVSVVIAFFLAIIIALSLKLKRKKARFIQ